MIVKNDLSDVTLFPKSNSSNQNHEDFAGYSGINWLFRELLIYHIFKIMALKKTKNTVFYDSVLFGMLLLYP
jgi:hypothetical protein